MDRGVVRQKAQVPCHRSSRSLAARAARTSPRGKAPAARPSSRCATPPRLTSTSAWPSGTASRSRTSARSGAPRGRPAARPRAPANDSRPARAAGGGRPARNARAETAQIAEPRLDRHQRLVDPVPGEVLEQHGRESGGASDLQSERRDIAENEVDAGGHSDAAISALVRAFPASRQPETLESRQRGREILLHRASSGRGRRRRRTPGSETENRAILRKTSAGPW